LFNFLQMLEFIEIVVILIMEFEFFCRCFCCSTKIANLVGGWELGRNTMKANSVWDTSENGSGECVNIWGDPPAVKKGVLLQQREKLWSRWKERYCILTRDYLHCFRRSTSIHKSGVRLSEMGSFIFKVSCYTSICIASRFSWLFTKLV